MPNREQIDFVDRYYRAKRDETENALKLTIDKIDKSLRTPLFRAIPRDNKFHVMLYNVGF